MAAKSPVADALYGTLISPNESDSNLEQANVVDGLFAVARAIHAVSTAIRRLGTAEASTPFGALEVLGMEIKTAGELISSALGEVATSIPPRE